MVIFVFFGPFTIHMTKLSAAAVVRPQTRKRKGKPSEDYLSNPAQGLFGHHHHHILQQASLQCSLLPN